MNDIAFVKFNDDFKNDTFQDFIRREYQRKFNYIVSEAKKMYLQREPTAEDEIKFKIQFGSGADYVTYIIYDGINFGYIEQKQTYSPEKGHVLTFTFYPTNHNLS